MRAAKFRSRVPREQAGRYRRMPAVALGEMADGGSPEPAPIMPGTIRAVVALRPNRNAIREQLHASASCAVNCAAIAKP